MNVFAESVLFIGLFVVIKVITTAIVTTRQILFVSYLTEVNI